MRGSARKNIELGLKLKHVDRETRTRKVDEVMSLLDITALADRQARSLSGGEAQKVAIAQILVLEPDVLILDEPFTYLDKRSIQDLENLILKLRDELNKTIIVTTHNQYQAQWLADQVYSVVNGVVSETQLINLFGGRFDSDCAEFNTGRLRIVLPEGTKQAEHVAIDPRQIVLSRHKLDSSMQNCFTGKVTGMMEENGHVKVSVNCGESFQAIVTHWALEELKLRIGGDIWISFKSTSILIF